MRSSKASIGSLSSMASKVRQEKKNSAAAKAKVPLARARASKQPFKSADKAGDSSSNSDSDSSADSANGSDSDDDLDAARAKFLAAKAARQSKANGVKPAATPAKPVSKGGVPTSAQKPAAASTSDSDSDSDSKPVKSSSDSSPSSRPPVAEQNKLAASEAGSKSSSDSTSSSGSSSDSEEASTQNKVVKGKALLSESSEESEGSEESDSDSDNEDTPSTSAQATVNGTAKIAASAVQESSSDESDGDDEGDGDRMVVNRTNGNNAATESASQMSRAQWLNNADFMLRKASPANPGKEVADFFSNANLAGKQVWYFTAPASLPITVLQDMEIDLSKATRGEALLTHNGDNYGLDLEPYATNTQIHLLIPSRGGDKYTSLNRGIDSTVHLRRMAKFGPDGEIHAAATDDFVPIPKPFREQPEGLRVRYTPIGVPTPPISSAAPAKNTSVDASSSQAETRVGVHSSSSESESENESDVDMTTPTASIAPASQTKSAKSGLTNGDRKRKHSSDENKAAKRLKAEQTTKVSSAKKQTPVQAPNPSATPSQKSSAKAKDKKEKAKKEKTPKSAVMTSTPAKQTPVPLPSYPGMKR
ncbi:DNA-directed RNA polymerase I subunit RPA34.5-domain-containing protein [Ustulina deusta]|nr:DNA-directed RNA polymerase I subunit RPA34.5-domain-containing protein [Ustulina deusta]